MCARYIREVELIKEYPVTVPNTLSPNFNVAPTHGMPVTTAENPFAIEIMNFGLVLHWAKDKKVGYSMLNARKETLLEKPSFKPLMVHNKRVSS